MKKDPVRIPTSRLFGTFLFLGMLWVPTSGPSFAGQDPLRACVVKIFTTSQKSDVHEPWRLGTAENVSGSGCVLPDHRILTNAHVVSNQIFVQVLKDGDSQKYTAKVLAVAHDLDLALLKVEDPKFFKGSRPVTFGELPGLRDKVFVYGYPVGGEELSITGGVVSRIEVVPYSHSMYSLLGVQTDAAINPGNSGGPVFRNKKMVGVAFQGYDSRVAQNTGFFIPTLFVKQFLKDVKKGGYRGVPVLGIYAESMENPALRAFYRMKKGQTGLLVAKVVYGSSAWGPVQDNDVLLTIDGFPISNDGTIPFRKGERLNFQYPVGLHRLGEKLTLGILRDGKKRLVTLTMKGDDRLVPLPAYDRKPSYFIFGGLVFTELGWENLVSSKAQDPALLALYFSGLPSAERKHVVLLDHVIPHALNKGYGPEFTGLVVTKVNGQTLSGLGDLVTAFKKPQDGWQVVTLEDSHGPGKKVVLKAEGAEAAGAEILKLNNIPSDRSEDLLGGKK